jgi:hypothetical protein
LPQFIAAFADDIVYFIISDDYQRTIAAPAMTLLIIAYLLSAQHFSAKLIRVYYRRRYQA